MQTDCPTEVERDRQMKGKRNGRMREMTVARMTGLQEKKKLPHTRDPEFATPKSQRNRYTDKDRERQKKKRGKNREKTVKSSATRKRVTNDDRKRCRAEAEKQKLFAVHMQILKSSRKHSIIIVAQVLRLVERSRPSHHFMLLLHLSDLLGVLLVNLLQFSHHTFTALTQSLFIVDQLRKHGTYFRPQGKHVRKV